MLDTRPLRATENGFHLGRVALKNGLTLCNFCDRRGDDCDLEPQTKCESVVPTLSFIPPYIGLDGAFSTFRASAIWYDRARVLRSTHKQVGLIDARSGEKLGRASVVNAVRGKFPELMEHHAYSNHLVKDQGMTRPEAAVWLTHWIKRNMGSRYATDPDMVGTVIYLTREPL